MNKTQLEILKEEGKVPEWLNQEALETLSRGYLLPGETVNDAIKRVSDSAASFLNKPEMSKLFQESVQRNWLCWASPIWSNSGTERGLPLSCLTGDTWLNTIDGGILMQDVKVGDKLLTHEGNFCKVLNKKSRMSNGDLYELKVGTRLTKLRITGNHPVLTNLGWVRVDQLDVKKHFVAVNDSVDIKNTPYTIDMLNYISYPTKEIDGKIYKAIENNGPEHKKKKNGIVEYYSAPNRFVQVTNDVAWAIGLWCAEGSKTTGKNKSGKINSGVRITMGVSESDTIERWLSIMKQNFGFNGSYYKSEVFRDGFTKSGKSSWLSANCYGSPLGDFFVKEFGLNCKEKTLPKWLIELPLEQLTHFMNGFIEGDGSFIKSINKKTKEVIENGTWTITLANPKLLLGLYNICLKLGIKTSLQMQKKPSKLGKTKYTYLLRSLKSDSIKLSANNVDSGIVFGKNRFCPILSLSKLDYDAEVFDVEVEKDHSFSACGVVVHNCNSIHVNDSIISIFDKNKELAMLTKHGAGVGIYIGDIRGRGKNITGNGKSDGIIPWIKVFDTTTNSVAQGSTRRGAAACYLPIEHPDYEDFLQIRRATGDHNIRARNMNIAAVISDDFMNRALNGDKHARKLWSDTLQERYMNGEPYLMFSDNANRQKPECYVKNDLNIYTSNICNEIYQFTDPQHTFVCCLSSLNADRYDEWKDYKFSNGMTLPELSAWFLEGIMSEYIAKASKIEGFDAAVRSAEKGRAIGLGVLGYHSYLQKNMIDIESFGSFTFNNELFRFIDKETQKATRDMAIEYGEPEWCKGLGIRNTLRIAVAPTASNSIISGGISAGIEPITSNIFSQKSAKGTFIRYNRDLKKLLESKGLDNQEVWSQINNDDGSVCNIKQLSPEEKAVFKTAREINQHTLIKLGAQRQKYIDQGQSLNLFFSANAKASYIHEVHVEAWKSGLKGLYYFRSQTPLKGESSYQSKDECVACES